MANKRKVNSGRTVYSRRPAKPPQKRVVGYNPALVKRIVISLAVIAAIFGVWHIFAIDKISIKGNSIIPSAEVERILSQSWGRHPFSRNLLTMFLAPLETDIMADQRVGEVGIKRMWPNKLLVNIKERHLSLTWKSAGKAYLVDSKGVAVAEGGMDTKLPQVTDSASLPVTVGDRVAPQGFVAFATSLAGELKLRTGLEIESMSVPDSTSELDVKTKTGYVVKFGASADVAEQLASLKTVLATLARLQKKPAQYIDLRVPGKAYYL